MIIRMCSSPPSSLHTRVVSSCGRRMEVIQVVMIIMVILMSLLIIIIIIVIIIMIIFIMIMVVKITVTTISDGSLKVKRPPERKSVEPARCPCRVARCPSYRGEIAPRCFFFFRGEKVSWGEISSRGETTWCFIWGENLARGEVSNSRGEQSWHHLLSPHLTPPFQVC